jgi:hypothetical protein
MAEPNLKSLWNVASYLNGFASYHKKIVFPLIIEKRYRQGEMFDGKFIGLEIIRAWSEAVGKSSVKLILIQDSSREVR